MQRKIPDRIPWMAEQQPSSATNPVRSPLEGLVGRAVARMATVLSGWIACSYSAGAHTQTSPPHVPANNSAVTGPNRRAPALRHQQDHRTQVPQDESEHKVAPTREGTSKRGGTISIAKRLGPNASSRPPSPAPAPAPRVTITRAVTRPVWTYPIYPTRPHSRTKNPPGVWGCAPIPPPCNTHNVY
eukprot:Filipodium_phascolosomae@DN2512_c0_g1_i1.p1